MPQKLNISRNLAGVEDLLLGVGVVAQIRGGLEVMIQKLNAKNLPFDSTQNLEQRLANIDDAAALVLAYGDVLTAITDNLVALLAIPQVEIIGNTGNAATLEGQTLAQVRANIDAATLSGQTVAQIKANVDAITLQGQTLAQVRAGIDAATLGGQTLAQVRAGIDAATLGGQTLAQVKDGGDAATLEGKTIAQITSQISFPDATTTDKGRVRLPTLAEAKAGTATDAVPTLNDVWTAPSSLVAWGRARITKANGAAAVITLEQGFGISSVSITPEGTFTLVTNKTFTGFCQMVPSGTFSGGTVDARKINGVNVNAAVNIPFNFSSYVNVALNTNNANTADIYINFMVVGMVV